jgi:hypothetical protein
MKDRYGYMKVNQKNYDPSYQMGTEMKVRKVERDGKPQLQIEVRIWTLKGRLGNEKLYEEYGYINLEGDELAEFEAVLVDGKETK